MKRGKGNPIPPSSRDAVNGRDKGRCQRCGSGRGSDHHHRRRRRETHSHDPHCPCNLLTLCRTCHAWAHQYPALAQTAGLILPSTTEDPSRLSVQTYAGRARYTCGGTADLV